MHAILLPGLDGGNPLGFLAALGTLRTAALMFPDGKPVLSWRRSGAWQPVLGVPLELSESELCARLAERLAMMRDDPALGDAESAQLGENLAVSVTQYRTYARAAAEAANLDSRIWADFAASFGTDGVGSSEAKLQDTGFRTMSGAGHQHFLGSIRELVSQAAAEDLHKALFQTWVYDDDRPTMRWDPADDRRYAYRWADPSSASRSPIRTVRGANRLAIEALPLFPTLPTAQGAVTTGFLPGTRSRTPWRWPIWEPSCPVEVVRSLLPHPALCSDPPAREVLAAMGVTEVYEAHRITVGKFRNFTSARAA